MYGNTSFFFLNADKPDKELKITRAFTKKGDVKRNVTEVSLICRVICEPCFSGSREIFELLKSKIGKNCVNMGLHEFGTMLKLK